ncbi:MAG: glycosyltransferase family 2 protein [Candidatus Microgenomates bacterium]
MKTQVFALLLNYNNSKDTIEAAQSLNNSDLGGDVQIVVIDNGTDNQRNLFTKKLPGSIYIKSRGNIGFAAGNNQGIRYALEHGATHILIMNPDVRVPKVFFKPLLSLFRVHKKAGIVAPAHREPGSTYYGLGGRLNWQNCSFPHNNVTVLPALDQQYDLLTFACVLIKAEVFKKVGLLDERYFLYLEDVDYCVSVGNAGYELWLNPRVCVTHRTSSSFDDSRKKIKFSFMSSFVFIKKWYRFPNNILPILHALYFYPYTYLLWTLKLYKRKIKAYVQ